MPTCFVCKQCLLSIKLLLKHFATCHPDHDFFEYRCVESGCSRTFHLINSFKKNLFL